MIKGILKIFGFGGDDDKAETTCHCGCGGGNSAGASSHAHDATLKDLENFVDYIVRALVDAPEEVRIESEPQENGASVIKINCKKEDIGKIVGKNGKTIMAIRSLVSGAAGRMQKRVAVEVID